MWVGFVMAYTVLMRLSFLCISMFWCPVFGSSIEDISNFPIEENSNIPSAIASNLTMTASTHNRIEVSWSVSDPECNSEFTVTLMNKYYKVEQKTSARSVVFNNLKSCTKYTASVSPGPRGQPVSTDVFTTTKVTDLEITVESPFGRGVHWSYSDLDCKSEFTVTLMNKDYKVKQKSISNDYMRFRYMRFNNLTECTNYTVSVSPEPWGQPVSTDFFTTAIASNLTITASTPNQIEVSWSDPPCKSEITVLLVHQGNLLEQKTFASSVVFKNLTECTKYNLYVYHGPGGKPVIRDVFTTAIASNLTMTASTPNLIEVSWSVSDPDCNSEFTVTLINTDYKVEQKTSARSVVFNNLTECTTYKVFVSPGPRGQPVSTDVFTTAIASNLTMTASTPNQIEVSWSEPHCKSEFTVGLVNKDYKIKQKTSASSVVFNNLTECTMYKVYVSPGPRAIPVYTDVFTTVSGCNISLLPTHPTETPAKRFVLHTDLKANWYSASRHCLKNNGRLARIENEEQQREIEQLLESSNVGDDDFFIGGTDLAQEGKWTWDLTGPELGDYRKWHRRQPDNAHHDEHCMAITSWDTAHHFWNDERCWSDQYFICEH